MEESPSLHLFQQLTDACRLQLPNCLSMFDHFVALALKGLKVLKIHMWCFISCFKYYQGYETSLVSWKSFIKKWDNRRLYQTLQFCWNRWTTSIWDTSYQKSTHPQGANLMFFVKKPICESPLVYWILFNMHNHFQYQAKSDM